MKITYNENPLRTTVELDEFEKKELWYKLKIEELQDLIFGAHFHLEEGKFFDIARARSEVDPDYYFKNGDEEKCKLDVHIDKMLDYYVTDLMGSHGGDCTCVPCSCTKCHAEHILGIDTLGKDAGKHMLSKIDGAFTYKDGDVWKQRTYAEALEILKADIPTRKNEAWKNFSQEDYEKHLPRWNEEQRRAREYLINYHNTHFGDVK